MQNPRCVASVLPLFWRLFSRFFYFQILYNLPRLVFKEALADFGSYDLHNTSFLMSRLLCVLFHAPQDETRVQLHSTAKPLLRHTSFKASSKVSFNLNRCAPLPSLHTHSLQHGPSLQTASCIGG
eukprot:scaffold30472_cov17-Tisochrysis_lutea.AAC.1